MQGLQILAEEVAAKHIRHSCKQNTMGLRKATVSCFANIVFLLVSLGFRRPSAAKTLAGSSGGDQSGRINSSHSVIQEFARSD